MVILVSFRNYWLSYSIELIFSLVLKKYLFGCSINIMFGLILLKIIRLLFQGLLLLYSMLLFLFI